MLQKFLYYSNCAVKVLLPNATRKFSRRVKSINSFQIKAVGILLTALILLGACAQKAEQESAALKKDTATLSQLTQINNSLNASNSITPENFTALKAILEKYPNAPETRQVYRSALVVRKDWETLQKFLTEKPLAELNDEDRTTLGQVYIKSGKYADAADTLESLADKNPNDVELQSLLGIALYHLGRLDESAARLDSVWNQITAEKRADEMILRGIIYFKQNNLAKAEEILKTADSMIPDNAAVNNALSQVYARQGKTDEAENFRRRTREINDKLVADELRSMRRVEQVLELENAWKAKNYTQVVILAKQILPATPNKSSKLVLYQYLAEAYKALGNQTEAQNALIELQKLQQQK